jgi:hypothetical protein
MKTKHKPKDKVVRMSHQTYTDINGLLELERNRLHKNFVNAMTFIPYENHNPKVKSGREQAVEIYRSLDSQLTQMQKELHIAAASTYKDHPNPDMRKFWGLE